MKNIIFEKFKKVETSSNTKLKCKLNEDTMAKKQVTWMRKKIKKIQKVQKVSKKFKKIKKIKNK